MRHWIPTSIFFFFLLLGSYAQAQVDSARVNRSPYHVIYNHLYYLQESDYDPAKAARSFPADTPDPVRAAIRLKQILDGKGIYVDVDKLPKDPDYTDEVNEMPVYTLSQMDSRITVAQSNDGRWFYSETTLASIPDLYKETFPLALDLRSRFHQEVWQNRFLGVELWQWLGLMALLLIFSIAFVLIRAVITPIMERFLKKRLGGLWAAEDEHKGLIRMLALIVSTRTVLYLLPSLHLSPRLGSVLIKSLEILTVFLVILLLVKLVALAFRFLAKAATRTENTMDDQLLPVIQPIITAIIWVLGTIQVLSMLEVNVTALLAGVSIGGLAIALAAQDTVKNFFGSLMIFLDKPFQIGDWIHFDGLDGTVEKVGVRSTRIRTFANSLTYVPNAKLADSVVDNMGLRQYRRYNTNISITYDTHPDTIERFVQGIRELVEAHPTTRKDYYEVHLNGMGASSLNILLYVFFEASNWSDELKAKHQLIYAILDLAHHMGVRFAFPTQTLHVEEFPGAGITTPSPKEPEEMENAMADRLAKAREYFQRTDTSNSDHFKPLGGA
ncbi:MAG: mechanosensitive ion channel family protein [Flavobacteriales bacterium]|nr:mechanosensitive ion channel family protein [Flavobacteriales bacterium]